MLTSHNFLLIQTEIKFVPHVSQIALEFIGMHRASLDIEIALFWLEKWVGDCLVREGLEG